MTAPSTPCTQESEDEVAYQANSIERALSTEAKNSRILANATEQEEEMRYSFILGYN